MNFKILLLVMIAAAGVASYGILSNDVELDIQKFDLVILPPMDGNSLESATQFSGVECACQNPSDPNDFSPDHCNVMWIIDPAGEDGVKETEDDVQGVPHPNSLGLNGNMLCTWEASSTIYGSLVDWDEGCSANYWLKSSDPSSPEYSWPTGFSPDMMYEDIFHIAMVKDDTDEKKMEKIKEKIKRYKAKIQELQDKGQIKKYTGHSLRWMLDAIPQNNNHYPLASKIMEKFYERLDLFIERKILYPIDKKYILEYDDNETTDHETINLTLLDALKNNVLKPHDKQISKESVAAILNAAHYQVNYHYSAADIIKITQDAVKNDNEIHTANEFKKHNLAGSLLCS